jgi:hypothetical protein
MSDRNPSIALKYPDAKKPDKRGNLDLGDEERNTVSCPSGCHSSETGNNNFKRSPLLRLWFLTMQMQAETTFEFDRMAWGNVQVIWGRSELTLLGLIFVDHESVSEKNSESTLLISIGYHREMLSF